jgi:MoaA/NifB/PqqE/SkfB family radical SAM enzyme
MDTQSWKKALLKLKKQANCNSVCFSGGEPFLRSDIFELIDFAESRGIQTLAISNGYVLCRLIPKIIRSSLSWLTITLNGLTPRIHDFTRGVKGSFDRTKEAILEINKLRRNRDKKLQLSIETILMPSTCNDVIRLMEWTKRQEIDGISFQIITNKDSYHSYYKKSALPPDEFKRASFETGFSLREREKMICAIKSIVDMKSEGYRVYTPVWAFKAYELSLLKPSAIADLIKCKTGEKRFFIDPYGNIRLCFNMSPIGSIKTMNLAKLLNGSLALKQRVAIEKCKKLCRLQLCNL